MRLGLLICCTLVGAAVTTAGCSGHGAPAIYDPVAPIVVVVRNNTQRDVDIFAEGDGGTRRLGSVIPAGSQTFPLPTGFLGVGRDLRLKAEPRAARGEAIQARVLVQPGQQVTWTIEPVLNRSYVIVR